MLLYMTCANNKSEKADVGQIYSASLLPFIIMTTTITMNNCRVITQQSFSLFLQQVRASVFTLMSCEYSPLEF